jgi:thiol-disulfide isomerase/thioredoxin
MNFGFLKKKSFYIYLFLIISLIGIGWYAYQRLKKSNLQKKDNSYTGQPSSSTIMLFFADWCPHCKKVKPIWENLRDKLDGKNIVFKEIDCSNDNPLKDKYTISGYPTFILINKNNKPVYFDGNPTQENLEAFIQNSI